MSGHSHWATIKHKKAATDAKKGKVFSKLAKALTVAAKHGGADPKANLALQYAMDKARAANMPRDNIDRAIKKGTGELEGETLEEITYEGYGPGGVAILVRTVTDNRNRTTGEIKKMFERHGGSVGRAGCVAWQFQTRALLVVDAAKYGEDKVLEAALEGGADDVSPAGGSFEVVGPPDRLAAIRKALADAGIETTSAEITSLATNQVAIDLDAGRKVISLLTVLEEHDDVETTHTNMEVTEELRRASEEDQ